MSTLLGDELPGVLLARLSGAPGQAPPDLAVPICTVDEEGFPHPALLSYSEIAAPSATRLRLTVHSGTRTAGNLHRDGRLTLFFVDETVTQYVKARVIGLGTAVPAGGGEFAFELEIAAVYEDAVDATREPDARIVSGIRFRRHERT